MARDYGRVSTRFWNSQDIRALSDRGKLLANYLLTGPHSNSIGAYLLPDAYVADDLGWSTETVSKALSELFEKGFCERFSDGRHIVVCKFLDWNPIENPNVGKGALKQLEQLPDDVVLHHVLDGLQQYAKQFPDGFETVLERLRNIEPDRTITEPKPEMDKARSADADDDAAVLEAFNSIAEELGWSKAQRVTPARKTAIRARLRECGGIEGWRAAMAKARASPFLRGETGRDKAHANWTPDLDFFLQQSTFTKLMEGKYDQRGGNSEPSGLAAAIAGARAVVAGPPNDAGVQRSSSGPIPGTHRITGPDAGRA